MKCTPLGEQKSLWLRKTLLIMKFFVLFLLLGTVPCWAGIAYSQNVKMSLDMENTTVHDVINEQVIEMVREGRVEMGIAFEPSPNHNLLFTPLAVDRFVAIVPQQSPLAKKKQLSWQELLTLDFITLQRPSAVRLMLEEALARSGRQLDVALESHQLVTVGRMVASGLGGSAVPALCEAQMTALGAVCIPLDNPPIEKCIGAIHPGHTQLSKAAHALLETLKDFYQPGQAVRSG